MKERRVYTTMNKFTKALIIIATGMIAAGMMLALIGFALGGFNSINFGSQGFYIIFEDQRGGSNMREDGSQSLDGRFTNVDINVGAYFIEMQEGDAYRIETFNSYRSETPVFEIKDGVLSVRDAARAKDNRRMLFPRSWLHALFNGRNSRDDIPTIRITYPSNARLGDVSIEASAGKAEIRGLEAASLLLDCAAGSLDIYETTVRDLSVNMLAGECEIEDVRAESAVFNMDAGSFSAEDFDCGALTGHFRAGTVDVEGLLRGDVDISANMGSVLLKTDLPESNYLVDLDVSLGSTAISRHTVRDAIAGNDNAAAGAAANSDNIAGAAVNGDNIAGASIGGSSEHSKSAPYMLRVKADMGDVNVDFASED
jgi:hypothetical protein